MVDFIIKVGTSVLMDEEGGIDIKAFEVIGEEITEAWKKGKRGVLVSSGALLCGMEYLGIKKIPKTIIEKMWICSVGQPILIETWRKYIKIPTAQILLIHDDFQEKARYENAKSVIKNLIKNSIIPIINENDSVAFEEIRVGDNDFLSSYISALLEAKKLIILSNTEGIITKNGIIKEIKPDEIKLENLQKLKSYGTTGGIKTKIHASSIASNFGVEVYIANGKKRVILKILEGENPGTRILPSKKYPKKISWLLLISKSKGKIFIDEGTFKAICEGKSILPVGVKSVQGFFQEKSPVDIVVDKKTVGKGITNYSSEEIKMIMGKKTYEVKNILKKGDEVIHRDNIVIFRET